MLLKAWIESLRNYGVLGGITTNRRRGSRRERSSEPVETLERRVMLTIDLDQPFSAPGGPVAIVSGRFDSNDSLDLVTLSENGRLTVALNGSGTAWASIESIDLDLARGVGLTSGLVNSDPFTDLAIQTVDGIAIAISDGAGHFTITHTLTPSLPGQMAPSDGLPLGLTLGLFDQDFATDLAVVVPLTNELLVYEGTSDGTFRNPVRILSGATQPMSVVTGQFVGSAAPDLAVAHLDGRITFFAGNGNGEFSQHSTHTLYGPNGSSPVQINSIEVTDINGDGESDLVVAAGDTAVVLRNDTDSLRSSPIVNGRFDEALTGWTTQIVGHTNSQHSGLITGQNGFAEFTKNESFITSLQQTFAIPDSPQTLSFDLRMLALKNSLHGIPDAFEVSLLDSLGNSLVPTHSSRATSFFNISLEGAASLANGVSFNGTTVTLDISGLTPGETPALFFDLIGHPSESSSTVVLDNVVIAPDRLTADTFSVIPLPGSFQNATGVTTGDVNGDGAVDVLVTDRAANSLLVFSAVTGDAFLRSDFSLTEFGFSPISVVAADLANDGIRDEVAVALLESSLVVSGLLVDQTFPTASLISPVANAVNTSDGRQLTVEFSEAVRNNGSLGDHSVANLNAWQLVEAGDDGTFGNLNDVMIPLQSVSYSAATRMATVTLAEMAFQDGVYQLTIEGSDAVRSIVDSSGNRLNGGVDQVFEFTINSDGPLIVPGSSLTGTEGQSLLLSATIVDPGGSGSHDASIAWGDGTTSTIAVAVAGGRGTLSLTHQWIQDGIYPVTITVSDDAGHMTSDVIQAEIANVAPLIQPVPPVTRPEGSTVSLLATFSDAGILDAHTAVIDWGDGTTSVGLVSETSGLGTVSGTHAFASSGLYSVEIVVSDDDNESTSTVTSIFIEPALAAPVVTSVAVPPGIEGSATSLTAVFTDFFDNGSHSALIQWGDGTTSIGTVLYASGAGTVTGSHLYADDADYSVSVTITDSTSLSGTGFATAAISNSVPVVITGNTSTVIAGTPLSGIIATFSDQGYSDSVLDSSETFTGMLDWGDGSSVQNASLTITNGSASAATRGDVQGTHTFEHIGSYTITVTVSDDDGGVGTATMQVVVVAPSQPPTISGPASVAEGSACILSLASNDFAPTAWHINWGDGTFLQTVPGTASSVSHTYTDDQIATITATAINNDGSMAAAPLTVTVYNVAPTISLNGLSSIGVDVPYQLAVAATDPGLDTIVSWIVNWGDGFSSTVSGSATSLSHVYTVAASRTLTVSAVDEDGTFSGPSKSITVIASTGNKPRFFVVDPHSDRAFRYALNGAALGSLNLGHSHDHDDDHDHHPHDNLHVRGVTTTGAGNPIWTIDKDGVIRVYDSVTGDSLGNWTAQGLKFPEDIATNGTDIWVVDRDSDRIYRYAGAAARRSGVQSAASSFALNSKNKDAYGLVTDGTKVWVVDQKARAVFVYNVTSGANLGQWTIDSRNDQPTGITIDPNVGNDLWIVDRKDGLVYRYAIARTRLSGLQNSVDSFVLSSDNKHPEGIADPTFPYTLNTVISSNISVAGEVDEYQFTATAGQRLFLDVQLVQSGVLHVFLKKPDGSTIIGYGNGPGAGNPDEEDGNFLLTQSGTYTMRVESLVGNTPAYQVAVYDVTAPDQATITVGVPLSGQIERPGGTDEWRIDITAGQSLWFQANSITGAFFVRSTLYSPTGVVVFNDVSPNFGPATLTESGTYRLVMDGLRDDTPSYTFTVRDTTPVIRNIQIGDVGEAAISSAQSRDIWRFHATAGQSVYVDFQAATDNGVQFQLVAPSGAVYASAGNFILSQLDQGPILLDQSGMWELRINGPGLTTPTYRFRLWEVPAPHVFSVSPGELYYGSIESPGSTDVFEFDGHAGQQIYIDFQQNGTWLDWNFRQPNGTLIQSASAFLISQLDGGPITLLSDGLHKLTVRGHGDSAGGFQLRFFDITPPSPVPILLNQIVTGSLNRPGQTPTFSFTGNAGSPLKLDVLFNENNLLAWKLVSPSGNTIFLNSTTDQTVSSLPQSGTWLLSIDQLIGAAADTTGQFSFRLINPVVTPPLPAPADLVVSSVVRPAVAVGSAVAFDLTWTVTNNGAGSASAANWVDRIYLSADIAFQRAAERIAGEFTWTGSLSPGASYTQTRTVTIPVGYEGDLTVIVETDALNQVFELTSEANNALISKPIAIYRASLPDGANSIVLDVTSGQHFPQGSTITLSGTASVLPATANLVFAIDLSASTADATGADANFDGLADVADDLNRDGSVGDILDVEIGSLLRILQDLRDNDVRAMVSIVAFASFAEHVDLSPLVGNQTFVSPVADADANGRFDIDEVVLSMTAGRVEKFREFELSVGTNFETTTLLIDEALDRALPAQSTEVIFLTDGGAPAPSATLLNRLANRGIDFFGFQIAGTAITDSLRFMANTIDANPSSSGRTQLITDPQDLGAALLKSLQITSVTVNGSDVLALDANGHFFTSVLIQPGSNLFVVEATDSVDRSTTATVTLFGVGPMDSSSTLQQDVTNRAATVWTHTTFNRFTHSLHADLALVNSSTAVLDVPVLAVFDSVRPLSVSVASADGVFPDTNRPFLRFDSEFAETGLPLGQTSSIVPVEFSNPLLRRFELDISLIGQGNRAPWFTSIPSMEAITNISWTSPLSAIDLDSHALTFDIIRGPVGMTVSTTTVSGISHSALSWTPSAASVGTHDIEVRVNDTHGGTAIQSWQLTVEVPIPLPDRPPMFRSAPLITASSGLPYRYSPVAIDPEGLVVAYELVDAPAGMSLISSETTAFGFAVSAVQWIPSDDDIGLHTIQLKATDPSGQAAFQTFTLKVKGANTPPQITTSPLTSQTAGGSWQYDVDAIDTADDVYFGLLGIPSGMEFDAASGQIRWQTSHADIGSYPLTVTAVDERGAVISQSFVLIVSADSRAPQVGISFSSSAISPGETVTITVDAVDNVNVVTRTITVNGVALTLNSSHQAVYTAIAPGWLTVVATAADGQGNIGTEQISLRVIDPADTTAPTIIVSSPQPADVVTYLTDIVGSIIDANLESYSVAWSPAFSNEWTTFWSEAYANADGVISNAAIATFDPTLLLNDAHDIRITASDISGNRSTYQFELSVAGNAKIGDFHLDFVDLTIPLAGIPITVNRSYDTLTARQSGDFGYGWMLNLAEGRIRETRPVLENESPFHNAAFRTGTRVYLNTPGGKRVGFTFDPIAEATLLGSQFHPRFTPDPGVGERLEVEDVPLRQNPDGTFKLYFGAFNYNPQVYTLIARDQVRYTYDQFDGLLSISNGTDVRLTYSDTGIHSSLGQSITWIRDDFGRITQITDPDGNHISYAYSPAGDLISVTDQAGDTTSMSYLSERPHFLSRAINSLGHTDFTATFDADGRLQTLGDGLGNQSTQSYELTNHREILGDRLGNETVQVFDDRGNIVASIGPLRAQFQMTYDANDHQTSVTDPLGRITQFEYDLNGNLARTTDPTGQAWLQTFNSDNELVSATNPLGQTTAWIYDTTGNVIQYTNAAGEMTSYIYDSQGRVTSHTDAMGEVTSYEYGRTSKPTRVIYPDGSTRSSTYNTWGDMTSFTNERGFTSHAAFDDLGRPVRIVDAFGGEAFLVYDGARLVSVTDQLGRTIRYEYDEKDRRIREINQTGGVRQIVYDANDQVTCVIDENGHRNEALFRADGQVETFTNPLGYTRHFTFDAAGNRLSVTDENGNVTRFAYDSRDRIVEIEDARGSIWTATWDAIGNRTSFTDANGHTTQFAYDVLNRLTQTTDAMGGIESNTYDEDGNVTSSTDANGHTSLFEYGERHRLKQTRDPAGNVQSWEFDELGNVILFTDELGHSAAFEYDALNRLVRQTDPLGRQTVNSWDAVGNLTQITDPLNRATTFTYDALDRRTSTTDPLGGTTTVTYDAVGNLLALIDPGGNTTSHVYDAADRLIQRTDPLAASDYQEYDGVGNLTRSTDRNGRVTEFGYDSAHQLLEERWLGSTGILRTIAHSYDPVGNLLSLSDPDSRYEFSWNALNRLVAANNSGTPGAIPLELTYHYDAAGNVLDVRDNFGVAVTSTYDPRHLLSTRTWSGPLIEPAAVEMDYDARGLRTEVRRFSDSLRVHPVGRTIQNHNGNGMLSSIVQHDALDVVFSDMDFLYDAADQLIRRDINGQATDYSWDATGQLISANHATIQDETYTYDANGNRTAGGRVVGANNRLLADSQFTYAWDAEGNLISQTSIADGSTIDYGFDHRNRLTQVAQRNSAGDIIRQTDFTYDAMDRRISKTVDIDGFGPSVAATTSFVYDGDHVWADVDASGNISARYLFGDGTDEILARQRLTEGVAWYLTDQAGSVQFITNADGMPIDQITYDSFGNVVAESSAAAGDRYRFTGREFDSETGLYYYRARYYSSSLGVFISQDPIGFGGGDQNLYRYVGNSPLAFTDPFGLTAIAEGEIVSSSGKRAASAFAGGTVGYACGYLEAWYSGNPNPVLHATKEAVVGATIGAALGPIVGRLPGQFQIFTGIALAVYAVGSGEDFVIRGLRGTCVVAEFAAGGGLKNLRHVADDLPPIPKSLDDWLKGLKRFLSNEAGAVPNRSQIDKLVLGRGSPEQLADVAEALGGRVIDNSALINDPKALWKHIYGEMKRAERIIQVMDDIPTQHVLGRGTGAWARAEKVAIDTAASLLRKTLRVRRQDLGL